MTDQDIYKLLMSIDSGYAPTYDEKLQLSSIKVIRWRGISKLPKSICLLSELIDLDVSLNRKLGDIGVLIDLGCIRNLNLCGTNVCDISPLSGMKKLVSLDLRYSAINDIKSLSGLSELTNLDLSDNAELKDLGELSDLKALKNLGLCHVCISDISAVSRLKSLKRLDLRYSTISVIPESLLDLDLDFKLEQYSEDPGIFIYGLNLTEQPVEIFGQDRDVIRAYFREQDSVPINECRVVFLGDPEAGKTHSIRRLLSRGESLWHYANRSTLGIEITVDTLQVGDSDIVVNYWDFGWQEIQHSMHRMFLTDRTIYVVFLNARQDPLDDRARYWLENICSLTKDAPVLLVINKIDLNERPKFNEDGIRQDYGSQIKKIVKMSALNDEPEVFLEELQGSINEIIRELPTISYRIPQSWKALMEDIRTMSEHYLTTEQFKERCAACGIQDYNTIHDDLVDLFQIIGISFCYYKNKAVADYMLLDPKWLINAINTIISNSNIVAHNGVITQDDLYDLLKKDTLHGMPIRRGIPDLRYESYQVNYILGVMRMFYLSYPMKDGSEFFPMLCDGNEKISVDKVMSENALHYIFRYTYLPANVMHRLIIEMQRDLDERFVWYSGAVFRNHYQKQIAYIYMKGDDLHIFVDTLDSYYNPNEYLTPILSIVRAINDDMNLSAAEYVTYRDEDAEAEIDAEELKANMEVGIERFYSVPLKKVISYKDVAHRYTDIRPKIKGDLLPVIIKALIMMQSEKVYYRTTINSHELEDIRNKYVLRRLMGAGYICADQQSGGLAENDQKKGEIDFVVRNRNEQDVFIYEGVNLSSAYSINIERHLYKLMSNYNPQGLPYGALVSYVDCDRSMFMKIVDLYSKHITEYTPDGYVGVGEPKVIPTIGQYLRCMEMDYEVGGQYLTIYHILVGMVEGR